ncbi:MAG: type II toxin-antitoxin system HipA family toxin [Kiritimatiellae bacterium]|jgi:serine/threonine-protein kinase HipA|nr:type II toxin-antitoxin system HipA family toxin [Kiritimatiellia bacterium]
MIKLNVLLKYNPCELIRVGTLVETDRKEILFEYDSKYLASGYNISPFKLNFSNGLQANKNIYPREGFGVFNDSLPDGWGLLLMDRFFRKTNRNIRDITILDRLAYIGNRGMGALVYEPAEHISSLDNDLLNLYELSDNSMKILQGKSCEILPVMAVAGGSPGGARPKILAGFDGKTLISGESELPNDFEHWIIKFRSEHDFKDAGKIEYIYAQMAKNAGVNISEFHLFEDVQGNSYFGTKRFDRIGCTNRRIHFHTLSNLIHSDFRIPSLDYEILLKVCSKLTGNYSDVKMCFRLMIFNIMVHNRDDHGKNFSFLMDDKGRWSFAPAYDLMFAYGPGGEHSLTVAGEGRNPTMKDVLKLAELADIASEDVFSMVDDVQASLDNWVSLASDLNVRKSDVEEIRTSFVSLK